MHVHRPGEAHSHAHWHAHSEPGSASNSQPGPTTVFLGVALLATSALVVAELAGGYFSHSVALTSDAVHNLSDLPTIVISWLAARWSLRPADTEKTYGYRRAGILAAFTNAILLILVALGLFGTAFDRFLHPVQIHEQWMIILSVFALAVNGGITLGLVRGRHDLNLRALLVHNFGDALSNIGIIAGALLIRYTGALWLDPALGAVIGALVLWSSFGILRESGHILLEGLPRQMRLADVAGAVLGVPGVQEVHDIHIWTIGSGMHALSCHVRIPDMHMEDSEKMLRLIRERLAEEFGIHHITVQCERAGLPESTLLMPQPFRSAER